MDNAELTAILDSNSSELVSGLEKVVEEVGAQESSKRSPDLLEFDFDPALLDPTIFEGDWTLQFEMDANNSLNLPELESTTEHPPVDSAEASDTIYEELFENYTHPDSGYEYPPPVSADAPPAYPITRRAVTLADGQYALEQFEPLSQNAILALLHSHLSAPGHKGNYFPITTRKRSSEPTIPGTSLNHDTHVSSQPSLPAAPLQSREKAQPRRRRSTVSPAPSGSTDTTMPVRHRVRIRNQSLTNESQNEGSNNTRAAMIRAYDAKAVYQPLRQTLPDWSSSRGTRYQYETSGELKDRRLLSVSEMADFLYENPRGAGLIIWIQRNPADSSRRYPHADSNRCRLRECVGFDYCINQGNYRVAFDELTSSNHHHDPFHNAGYMHLYCLEKFFDFPKLIRDLDIRVEDRNLPMELKGLNKMSLPTVQERKAAVDFVKSCQAINSAPLGYPRFGTANRKYEGWLCHTLSETKVLHDRSLQRIMRQRGVKKSTIGYHKGNLEIEAAERHKTRLAQNQTARTTRPRKAQPLRRMAVEEEEDDVDEEEEYDDEEAPLAPKHRHRYPPRRPAPIEEEEELDEDQVSHAPKRRRVSPRKHSAPI